MEQQIDGKKEDSDKYLVPGAIFVAGLIVAGAVLYNGGAFTSPKGPGASGTVAVGDTANVDAVKGNIEDDDPSLGNPDAPVVLVEFSDFQCPFCRRLWKDSFEQLKDKYIKGGQVRLVYRDFPLTGIHPAAEPSALAAECADDQGKFWEMHDKIFIEQEKLGAGTQAYGVPELKRWAKDISLNVKDFDSCLDGQKHKSEVAKDLADGSALGVNGTPHIFVNGKPLIRGALPWEQIDGIIQQELTAK